MGDDIVEMLWTGAPYFDETPLASGAHVYEITVGDVMVKAADEIAQLRNKNDSLLFEIGRYEADVKRLTRRCGYWQDRFESNDEELKRLYRQMQEWGAVVTTSDGEYGTTCRDSLLRELEYARKRIEALLSERAALAGEEEEKEKENND